MWLVFSDRGIAGLGDAGLPYAASICFRQRAETEGDMWKLINNCMRTNGEFGTSACIGLHHPLLMSDVYLFVSFSLPASSLLTECKGQ
jgi:hypothetical protein